MSQLNQRMSMVCLMAAGLINTHSISIFIRYNFTVRTFSFNSFDSSNQPLNSTVPANDKDSRNVWSFGAYLLYTHRHRHPPLWQSHSYHTLSFVVGTYILPHAFCVSKKFKYKLLVHWLLLVATDHFLKLVAMKAASLVVVATTLALVLALFLYVDPAEAAPKRRGGGGGSRRGSSSRGSSSGSSWFGGSSNKNKNYGSSGGTTYGGGYKKKGKAAGGFLDTFFGGF